MAKKMTEMTDRRIAELAAAVAKKAGVGAEDAERVLRALRVEQHIDEAADLMSGRLDPAKVKLAYRVSTGGVVA